MRIRATGILHRRRQIKMSRGSSIGDLLGDIIAQKLHEDGKLSDKFYYPEEAYIAFTDGSLEAIGPRACILHLGKNGTAARKLWQAIPDGSAITIIANVEPWRNGIGGTTTRVFSIEPAHPEAEESGDE